MEKKPQLKKWHTQHEKILKSWVKRHPVTDIFISSPT